MSNLLTKSDLEELTGYQIPSKQCKALNDAGIGYVIRKDGMPSLTWDALNAGLTKSEIAKPATKSIMDHPDFNLGAS